MRTCSVLAGTLCAALSLPAIAAHHPDAAGAAQITPSMEKRDTAQVRTADTGYATPEMLKLDPQVVVSQGGSLRPGPHNRHFRPPHGGPVTVRDRSEVAGRE